MFVRSLSLLLILGVAATQLARVPHAHEGMSAAENHAHNGTPHVHLSLHAHVHSQPHHHWTRGGETQSAIATWSDCESHDATVILLCSEAGAATASSPAKQIIKSTVICQFVGLIPDLEVLAAEWRTHRPPEFKIFDLSETYLTLRQLRI